MKYYDDKTNAKGAYLLFIIVQVVLLLIVYGFVYSALVAVKLAIQKYHLTMMAYMPVVFVMFAYPVVLYKTRKIFRCGDRISAIGWMLGWAALFIVVLYVFLANLVGV